MRKIKIGVNVRFKNPEAFRRPWNEVYQEHLQYSALADALGFDGIWVAEHHCVPSGYNPTPFVALAAVAQVTKNCRIGTAPLLLPLYNPVLAAEQAAVVDVLSSGRLILCCGTGYYNGDFDVVGIPRNTRGARMDEALPLLCKALWQREAFDHAGRFFGHKGVHLSPPPVQEKMEVQVAIRSVAAARRVALPGVNVNLNSPAVAKELGPRVAEIAASAGRNPAEIGVGLLLGGFLAGGEDKAVAAVRPFAAEEAREYIGFWNASGDAVDHKYRAIMEETLKQGAPLGCFTPEAFVTAIDQDIAIMAATGLRPDWINVNLWPPGMEFARAKECLERFAAEVLPHV